jgi:hypothetical protein
MLASSALAVSLSLGVAHAQESVSAADAENGNLWFVESSGLPWLAKTTSGSSFSNNVAGEPHTTADLDLASFAIHLDHYSRRLRIEAFDTNSGKGRSTNLWFRVPNGRYVAKVSVLKALSDESNPAHRETWTSPTITIARA